MNKALKILMWTGLMAYMLLVLGLVADRTAKAPCQSIEIEILDSLSNSFVSRDEVYGILHDGNRQILGSEMGRINTLNLEERLNNTPFIKEAEIYKSSGSILNIHISQRKPIVRVLTTDGRGYYIDSEGYILPLDSQFTARVLVANGHKLPGLSPGVNIMDEQYAGSRVKELYEIALYIFNNEFWEAQLEQVYIKDSGEFLLIPRVGAHIIEFGSLRDYEEKFKKLKALYSQGFLREGWNKYSRINLKYEGQVVCTKK